MLSTIMACHKGISKFARSIPEQFLIVLRKFFTLYNRMPEYNAGLPSRL